MADKDALNRKALFVEHQIPDLSVHFFNGGPSHVRVTLNLRQSERDRWVAVLLGCRGSEAGPVPSWKRIWVGIHRLELHRLIKS